MHVTTRFLAALLPVTALAAPATSSQIIPRLAEPDWTITSVKRSCNAADTSCVWSFGINTHLSSATPCVFSITGSTASRAANNGHTCGAYTVTSGWSGQWGDGNGFTTMSIVDQARKRIVWPAYTDKQLARGAIVAPDQSYPPSAL
ncbi:hypothetical protein BJ170DRAFT_678657 [Xylariales sp. AK1849]|nr:hypothetical protein BJ170DRAFT_678657 [Xylariales sp. AK1849]